MLEVFFCGGKGNNNRWDSQTFLVFFLASSKKAERKSKIKGRGFTRRVERLYPPGKGALPGG